MENEGRRVFQDRLKAALDAYHRHWETGYKSIGEMPLPKFSQVTAETLKSWVKGEHYPKTGVFSRFLEEAHFPLEIQQELLYLHRTSVSERKNVQEGDDNSQNQRQKQWVKIGLLGAAVLLCLSIGIAVGLFIRASSQLPVPSVISIVTTVPATSVPISLSEDARVFRRGISDWCYVLASNVTMTDGTPPTFTVSFSKNAPLGRFQGNTSADDAMENYFYFNADVNSSSTSSYIETKYVPVHQIAPDGSEWQYQVRGKWTTPPTNWMNRDWWRIDFLCGSPTPVP